MTRRIVVACLMLLCLPVVAPAQTKTDFTGTWTGSFLAAQPDGQVQDEKIQLDLKQTGADLTGKAGPNADEQYPLAGKVDGDNLTFDVTTPGPAIKFVLTLTDGHLKGDATIELQGQSLKATVDAQRKK